jgi:hypothetical protein
LTIEKKKEFQEVVENAIQDLKGIEFELPQKLDYEVTKSVAVMQRVFGDRIMSKLGN